MRWSAIPGSSRHHWGTDLDVYDAAAVTPDYQVQLTPQEWKALCDLPCLVGSTTELVKRLGSIVPSLKIEVVWP